MFLDRCTLNILSFREKKTEAIDYVRYFKYILEWNTLIKPKLWIAGIFDTKKEKLLSLNWKLRKFTSLDEWFTKFKDVVTSLISLNVVIL